MMTQTLKAARLRWNGLRQRSLTRGQRMAGICTLGVLTLAYAVSSHFQIHTQLYQHAQTWLQGNRAPGQNIWLPDYRVSVDALPLGPDVTNLSGITYDYDNDRLLAITNRGPMQLLVLDKQGALLGRYPLVGFEDTEGLAYLGNGRIVICDENLQQLDILTLPTVPGPIEASGVQSITLDINPSRNNKGLEGVTYDPQHDRLFAIKERDPLQLFEVTGVLQSLDSGHLRIKVSDRHDWIERSIAARDLSDGYYDPGTGHLLLLSDQSRSVTELDRDGRFVSIRSLLGGVGGLQHSAPQPEGMTLDRDGNLYVVSEPNLFYKFAKASPGAQ